jgi:diguanylate cyclase (GGDEF)-like protein
MYAPAVVGVRDKEIQRLTGLVFTGVWGLAGWTALALGGLLLPPEPSTILSFLVFLCFVLCARALAIPLTRTTVVSLDAGFYLAAASCLGPWHGGLLVAIALTADSFSRAQKSGGRVGIALWNALYFGGMSGALLMILAKGLGLSRLSTNDAVSDAELIVSVLATGILFLLAHYAIRGIRLALAGQSFREYVKEAAIPGIVAESSLLPLAVVIVFLYQPGYPLRIAVLGTLFLICNYGFNRIYANSSALRLRVQELEILSTTSRTLSNSLQSHEIVPVIARETLAAIPSAERLSLAWSLSVGERDLEEEEPWTIARFDGNGQPIVGATRDGSEAARDWVRSQRTPLCMSDRERPGLGVALEPVANSRSWLGVPLEMHNHVLGVLSVESDRANAFGPHESRLLGAIGAQAAVSLQNARLYELAMVDGLTKLFVRRYFDARLAEEIHRAERFGTEFSVVMMDVDNFKQLNDTYGHPIGDQLLLGFAEIIRCQMRGADTAARYGGEEFAIILPRTKLSDARNLADRVRRSVREFVVMADGVPVKTTASFGIAALPESGASTAEQLIRLADLALYRAKRCGKDRVELSWPNEPDQVSSVGA